MDTEVKNDTEVTSGTEAATDTPTLGAAKPPMDWRETKASELAKLCKAATLPTSGKRDDLVRRLDRYYHGSSKRHVHGKTLCPYCKAPARCNGTRRMSDTMLRRSFRCTGKRRHSFTIDSSQKA
jgi:hypothetical protein